VKPRQACAHVCGDETILEEFYPFKLVANKTQMLYFQYDEAREKMLKAYVDKKDFQYYACLERYEDLING
jgi:hypothetical protein